MAETVASRVSRIVMGGTHALLDKAENLAPEAVMTQAIREIEQVAGEVRGDLGKCEAAKHLVLARVARLNAEHEALAEQIELALNESRDDLARAAIARQADIEDLLPVLQKSLDEQGEQAREYESYLVALQAKKRELEQTLNDFRRSQESAAATGGGAPASKRQSRVDEAEANFARIVARQTGASGLVGGGAAESAKLRELAEMQRNNRIAERLAALKAGRGGKSA
ncbi:MAG: PspA/IM30 family protein [Betaproteobacteria bacterium]|nr:PspA/IM30 family protein [Betaproteobacteria bacterium]